MVIVILCAALSYSCYLLPRPTQRRKGARPCDRTPSLNGLAYLLCGQSGQEPVQSAITCATAGAAAKAPALADSSRTAANSFFMIFSID
jgi:hypothetical protein